MKKVLFPSFGFLYSYIETWLSNMAKKGYCLVSQKGWLWYFEKRNPCDKKYFLWLQRLKGRDCSNLASDISTFYGIKNGEAPVVKNTFLRITEMDIKKIDENVSHYYKKRNYICLKISGCNFLFVSSMFAICIAVQFCEFLCGIFEIIFAFNFLFNLIQYIKGKKTGNVSASSDNDQQN